MRRALCWLLGHAMTERSLDAPGRRVSYSRCDRCDHVESVVVAPRNRAIRRRWAREVAKEIAR